jgi:hypothetical protein
VVGHFVDDGELDFTPGTSDHCKPLLYMSKITLNYDITIKIFIHIAY